MIDRCLRILRHRWLDEQHSRRVLGPAGLQRIQEAIVESERHHSGEIRVCIEAGLPWSYLRRGADARERAVTLFGKLKVWDTEHNNGVLIYLLLADHRIEVVADRGLNRQVDAREWQSIVEGLAVACREKHFEAGLLHAIEMIDALLRGHFPAEAGSINPNELPDAAYLI